MKIDPTVRDYGFDIELFSRFIDSKEYYLKQFVKVLTERIEQCPADYVDMDQDAWEREWDDFLAYLCVA